MFFLHNRYLATIFCKIYETQFDQFYPSSSLLNALTEQILSLNIELGGRETLAV